MSALCSVAVLSKNGQSHIANQMQLAEPMMVVFDNYAITEWETALVDPRLQALILDANSLTLAQLQSLQDAYLSENWRSELSVFLWDYQQKKNERFHLWPVLTYAKNATDLLLAQVCSHLQAKAATPFFSALKSYLSKHADSWHTPVTPMAILYANRLGAAIFTILSDNRCGKRICQFRFWHWILYCILKA